MYLISLYFDQQTNERIQYYIEKAAKASGNYYVPEHNIPAHLTISMLQSKNVNELVEIFQKQTFDGGKLSFVSTGTFRTNTIFLQPVCNAYLYELIARMEQSFSGKHATESRYRLHHWIPHITIAKRLSAEGQRKVFDMLQKEFHPFEGKVEKIGLAKTNPYKDIIVKKASDVK